MKAIRKNGIVRRRRALPLTNYYSNRWSDEFRATRAAISRSAFLCVIFTANKCCYKPTQRRYTDFIPGVMCHDVLMCHF